MGDGAIRKTAVRVLTPDARATKPKPPPKAEGPAPAKAWTPKSDGRVAADSQGERVELRAEVKVGFGEKGAPARLVSVGIDRKSKGFFGATPERDARAPWNELSVSAPERYRSFGYGEKTWRNW